MVCAGPAICRLRVESLKGRGRPYNNKKPSGPVPQRDRSGSDTCRWSRDSPGAGEPSDLEACRGCGPARGPAGARHDKDQAGVPVTLRLIGPEGGPRWTRHVKTSSLVSYESGAGDAAWRLRQRSPLGPDSSKSGPRGWLKYLRTPSASVQGVRRCHVASLPVKPFGARLGAV